MPSSALRAAARRLVEPATDVLRRGADWAEAGAVLLIVLAGMLAFYIGLLLGRADFDALLAMPPGAVILNARTNTILSRFPSRPDGQELYQISRLPLRPVATQPPTPAASSTPEHEKAGPPPPPEKAPREEITR